MPLQILPSDPLEAYSGLSLFPQTFASFPNPPPSYDPDNLQSTHDFLNSMPFETSDDLIEQAKAIVADSSQLLSSDVEVMENIRERRPALDRKRPRFSLKPNSSQATVNLEPSLDIDILNDPEEFFVAFERVENAKREIKKQTGGVLMERDQNIQSVAERPRRPGLLRRSVKYQHRYSTALSPVASFVEEIPTPVCHLQEEKSDPDVELQEKLNVANAENTVNELLDDLLTSNYDGDEAMNLLQERLQIKPIDLEKISLPDLPDIRRFDLKVSRENLVKPRNSLSDIQSLMKGMSKRTPKRKAERSVDHFDSPTPPRSPLASISLLMKQKLHPDALSDPFSTDNANQSSVGNASHIESNSNQSDQVDAEKELSEPENNDRQHPESPPHNLASPTPPRNLSALQKKQMLHSDPDFGPLSTDNIDHSPGRNASPIESANEQPSQVDKMELNNLPTQQKAERSVDHFDSPTLPRSPLASISLLKKQKLQPDVLSDPFSTDNADQSSVGSASHIESNSNQSDQVEAEKQLSESENNDRQQPESPPHNLASPTPPRNLSALQKKQMLHSDPDFGPLSTDNIDHSPGRNASPIESAYEQSSHFDSPMPPRSPLASISLLKKQKLQFDVLSDLFSTDNANQSSVGNASHIESNSNQSDQVDAEKELSEPENNDRQQPESPPHHLASPTPPRNLSALQKKQMLHSDPDFGPLSTDNIDHSPGRNASPIESNSNQSDQVDAEKELSEPENNDRQQPESPPHHLASPTPPRNLSALQKKQMLHSDPDFGPLSTDNIDHSPGRNASPIESANEQPSQVDKMELNNLPLLEANLAATANASPELDGRDFAGLFDKYINDNARRSGSGTNVVSSGSQANLENINLRMPETESDSHTTKSNEYDGMVEDIPLEEVVSSQIQVNVEGPTIDNSGAIQNESDESNPAIDEDHTMNGSAKATLIGEQLHERQNKKGKIKPQPVNKQKRKAVSRRQSLAASGTTFDVEGRRRSTRIRSRPLEFWKGERFLYGRVHSSLATVIGIKYESPGKSDGANPTLKVKSFVGDEYKELIDQAARF